MSSQDSSILPQEKSCVLCTVKQALDEYGPDTRTRDGKSKRCLTCHAEREAKKRHRENASARQKRACNPEYFRAMEQKSRQKRFAEAPEQVRAKGRADARKRWAARSEELRLYGRKRRAAHLEHARAVERAAAAKRRPRRRFLDRQRHAANPQKVRKALKKLHAANPALYKGIKAASEKRRRATKLHAPVNDLTHTQWLEIQEVQKHRCYFCRKRRKSHLTQDHLTALSNGGSHTLHNVIAVCQSCNSKKGKGPAPMLVQPLLLTVAPAKKPA